MTPEKEVKNTELKDGKEIENSKPKSNKEYSERMKEQYLNNRKNESKTKN